MTPASRPIQRPLEARLLAIEAAGRIRHIPRADFVGMLRHGDLVIANDAATLPASLPGSHVATGDAIYIAPNESHQFEAIGDEPLGFLCVIPSKELLERLARGEARASRAD